MEKQKRHVLSDVTCTDVEKIKSFSRNAAFKKNRLEERLQEKATAGGEALLHFFIWLLFTGLYILIAVEAFQSEGRELFLFSDAVLKRLTMTGIQYGPNSTANVNFNQCSSEGVPFSWSQIQSFDAMWDFIKFHLLDVAYEHTDEPSCSGANFGRLNQVLIMGQLRQIRSRPATECNSLARLASIHSCYLPLGKKCTNQDKTAIKATPNIVSPAPNMQSSPLTYSEGNSSFLNKGMYGKVGPLYPNGGFIAYLGKNKEDSFQLLENLQSISWVNSSTRAVFFEIAFFNPNIDSIAMGTLLLEAPLGGGIIPSATVKVASTDTFWVPILEASIVACVLAWTIFEVQEAFLLGRQYLRVWQHVCPCISTEGGAECGKVIRCPTCKLRWTASKELQSSPSSFHEENQLREILHQRWCGQEPRESGILRNTTSRGMTSRGVASSSFNLDGAQPATEERFNLEMFWNKGMHILKIIGSFKQRKLYIVGTCLRPIVLEEDTWKCLICMTEFKNQFDLHKSRCSNAHAAERLNPGIVLTGLTCLPKRSFSPQIWKYCTVAEVCLWWTILIIRRCFATGPFWDWLPDLSPGTTLGGVQTYIHQHELIRVLFAVIIIVHFLGGIQHMQHFVEFRFVYVTMKLAFVPLVVIFVVKIVMLFVLALSFYLLAGASTWGFSTVLKACKSITMIISGAWYRDQTGGIALSSPEAVPVLWDDSMQALVPHNAVALVLAVAVILTMFTALGAISGVFAHSVYAALQQQRHLEGSPTDVEIFWWRQHIVSRILNSPIVVWLGRCFAAAVANPESLSQINTSEARTLPQGGKSTIFSRVNENPDDLRSRVQQLNLDQLAELHGQVIYYFNKRINETVSDLGVRQ